MRFKVILPAVIGAALILVSALYLHNASVSPPPGPQPAQLPAAFVANSTPRPRDVVIPSARLSSPPVEAPDPSAPEHSDYVIERKTQLIQLGLSDDPAALKVILSELNNRDPDIRRAALNATIDFGSQDAIPMLKNEIAWTDDLQEKVDIQNAIDFLQLPPVEVNNVNSNSVRPAAAPAAN